MNCRYCGGSLSPGALFCGSCGRTLGGSGAPRVRAAEREVPVKLERVEAEFSCPQCGATAGVDDVFCRACGFVLRNVRLGGGRDTVAITQRVLSASRGLVTPPQPTPDGVPLSPPLPMGEPLAPPDVWGRLQETPLQETPLQETPLQRRETFVFQFSTGESVIVAGSGLIGRSPRAEPGERVDQLVIVGDVGKSVSKTHAEFGQDEGELWVSDRWSTNGTVFRVPGAQPRRCEPGRRYRVPRGTRVEIGDQFFTVS